MSTYLVKNLNALVISLQLQCFIYKAVIFPNKDMVLSRTFVTEKGLATGCKAYSASFFFNMLIRHTQFHWQHANSD